MREQYTFGEVPHTGAVQSSPRRSEQYHLLSVAAHQERHQVLRRLRVHGHALLLLQVRLQYVRHHVRRDVLLWLLLLAVVRSLLLGHSAPELHAVPESITTISV